MSSSGRKAACPLRADRLLKQKSLQLVLPKWCQPLRSGQNDESELYTPGRSLLKTPIWLLEVRDRVIGAVNVDYPLSM